MTVALFAGRRSQVASLRSQVAGRLRFLPQKHVVMQEATFQVEDMSRRLYPVRRHEKIPLNMACPHTLLSCRRADCKLPVASFRLQVASRMLRGLIGQIVLLRGKIPSG